MFLLMFSEKNYYDYEYVYMLLSIYLGCKKEKDSKTVSVQGTCASSGQRCLESGECKGNCVYNLSPKYHRGSNANPINESSIFISTYFYNL